jgi:hypothetical protein
MPYEVILYRKNSGQVMGQFGPYARKADADADARALSTQSNPDWGTMVKKVGAALGRGAKATGRGIAKGVKHGTEYAREGAARASETALDTASKAKDAVVMAKLSGRVEGLESCYEALGGRGALGGVKLEGLGAYREAQDELHDYQEGSKRGAYKRKTSRETAREKRAGARESRLASNPSGRGAAEDLVLFITNDGDLYRSQTTPIITNLARKKAKGTFNKKLAPKLFQYLADAGAKKINRLEGFRGRGYGEFTPDSRRAAAKELLDYYMEQINEEAKELKKGKKKNPQSRKTYEWTDDGKPGRYKVVEGFDHYNDKPLYHVTGVNNDYVGEWHTSKASAKRELDGLKSRKNPQSRKKFTVKAEKDGITGEWDVFLYPTKSSTYGSGGSKNVVPHQFRTKAWAETFIRKHVHPMQDAGMDIDQVGSAIYRMNPAKSRKNGSSPLKFSFQWSKEGGSVKFRKGKAGKVGRIEVSVTPRSVFPAYLYEDAPNWGSLKDYINVVRSDGGKAVPYDTKVKVYKAAQEALESEMVKQR